MEAKKEPDGNSIYELHKLFATKEEVDQMAANFRAGGYDYGSAKKELLNAVFSIRLRRVARNS